MATTIPDAIDTALRRLRKAPRAQAPALLSAFRDDPALSRQRSHATGRLPAHEVVLAVPNLNQSRGGTPPEDGALVLDLLRLLLVQAPETAHVPDPIGGGWFPLHRALKSGGVDDDVFPALLGLTAGGPLDNAVDLCNTPDPEQCLPLIRAIRSHASEELIMLLLESGGAAAVVHQHQGTKQGWNALHFAARYHAPIGAVRCMLSMAAESAKAKASLGITPLHIAVSAKASLEVVRLLLEFSDVGVEDSLFRTPLSIAVRLGQDNPKGVLEELLAKAPSDRLVEYASDKFVMANATSPAGRHYSGLRTIEFVRGSKLGAANT
eukprot:g585.t1